jgi:hypothetical protein
MQKYAKTVVSYGVTNDISQLSSLLHEPSYYRSTTSLPSLIDR